MGIVNLPFYGYDIGSAIETAEEVIAKIKTNKFDNDDVAELRNALAEIEKALSANEA
jgi:hypothetical protein